MHENDYADSTNSPFSPVLYLATSGTGRKIAYLPANSVIFGQDDANDAVFYLQEGHARLRVLSALGKEGTITLLSPGDFIGSGRGAR